MFKSLLIGAIATMTALTQPKIMEAHATAYCVSGTTYSGQETREGICAGKKEWIGKTIIVYQKLPGGEIGDLIGYYECLDTGKTNGLKTGKVIDIWCPDLEACQKLMDRVYENGCKGKIYIQVLEADG